MAAGPGVAAIRGVFGVQGSGSRKDLAIAHHAAVGLIAYWNDR